MLPELAKYPDGVLSARELHAEVRQSPDLSKMMEIGVTQEQTDTLQDSGVEYCMKDPSTPIFRRVLLSQLTPALRESKSSLPDPPPRCCVTRNLRIPYSKSHRDTPGRGRRGYADRATRLERVDRDDCSCSNYAYCCQIVWQNLCRPRMLP